MHFPHKAKPMPWSNNWETLEDLRRLVMDAGCTRRQFTKAIEMVGFDPSRVWAYLRLNARQWRTPDALAQTQHTSDLGIEDEAVSSSRKEVANKLHSARYRLRHLLSLDVHSTVLALAERRVAKLEQELANFRAVGDSDRS